jgi:hypothetical protein
MVGARSSFIGGLHTAERYATVFPGRDCKEFAASLVMSRVGLSRLAKVTRGHTAEAFRLVHLSSPSIKDISPLRRDVDA